MFKKKDNNDSVQKIVERNTGLNTEELLKKHNQPYIYNLKEAVKLLLKHKDEEIHIIEHI